MSKSKKLSKVLIISASSLALLMAGGNLPNVPTTNHVINHIEVPVHASNNKIHLHKAVISKQFKSLTQHNSLSEDTKRSNAIHNYLKHINNLNDYKVRISNYTKPLYQREGFFIFSHMAYIGTNNITTVTLIRK